MTFEGIGAVAYPSLCEWECPSFDFVDVVRLRRGATAGGDDEDMCMTVMADPVRGTNPMGSSFTMAGF